MRGPRRNGFVPAVLLALCSAWGSAVAVQSVAPGGGAGGLGVDRDCHPRPVRAAVPYDELSLGGLLGCSAGSVLPWSVAFAPSGGAAYVSLFGGLIGNGGCLLAKVDVASRTLLGLVQVEESPQEIVFTTFPNGSTRHGWVACSSASSVVVFDANDQIVASIPIPIDAGSGWPTAFPSGLALSPDQRYVYVGTLDGSGRVFVLDARTPALLPSRTLHLGGDRGFGRLIASGDMLLIPSSRFHAGGQGSTAEVIFVDARDESSAVVVPLASADDGVRFPSSQDAALACDGRLFVVGFDMGPWIHVLDASSKTLLRSLPTFTSQPLGKFQALGLSPAGLLAVADFYTDEVSLYDVWSERWLGLVDDSAWVGPHSQLNELAFEPLGGDLWSVGHTSHDLAFLDVP